MLYRKIGKTIKDHFLSQSDKILLIEGARQIGKTFIIRHVGKELFANFVEINLAIDKNGSENFKNVRTTEDFYLTVGAMAGASLNGPEDTLIFLDGIQEYPQLLTLLKFLRQDNKYKYIASGSILGITLKHTTSIPIGSIRILNMYPLDFEEFLIANNVGEYVVDHLRECFSTVRPPLKSVHDKVLELFRRYLLSGGMPDAVNEFLQSRNIVKVRDIQMDIHRLYGDDAAKYDIEHKLRIIRIYNMLPSVLAQHKKRLVFKDIEQAHGKRSSNYADDIDYLIDSGITLPTKAISNPKFPLLQSQQKNLLKLYLNDAGILSALLYGVNIRHIIDNIGSVNLGAVYECAIAMELKAHGHNLFYYDNKRNGEVDFLVDDYNNLAVLPIEVKSGKDYYIHSALNRLLSTADYGIQKGIVLSNSGETRRKGNVIYYPVYMVMFISNKPEGDIFI